MNGIWWQDAPKTLQRAPAVTCAEGTVNERTGDGSAVALIPSTVSIHGRDELCRRNDQDDEVGQSSTCEYTDLGQKKKALYTSPE